MNPRAKIKGQKIKSKEIPKKKGNGQPGFENCQQKGIRQKNKKNKKNIKEKFYLPPRNQKTTY